LFELKPGAAQAVAAPMEINARGPERGPIRFAGDGEIVLADDFTAGHLGDERGQSA
jgi:glutamyl-tRNA reductase